jgi:hypothetical protein
MDVPPQESLWLIGARKSLWERVLHLDGFLSSPTGGGILGQAYAWTLGFLPSGARAGLLQDVDVVSESTLATSLVSHASNLGQKKTRMVARWLEARGYQAALSCCRSSVRPLFRQASLRKPPLHYRCV